MVDLSNLTTIKAITPTEYNLAQIEYIKRKYPDKRNRSKPITFALQYFGNAGTLVNNSGFLLDEANSIIANYKALYKVSEEYKDERLRLASEDGYADVAFGLRVRTPAMQKSVLNTSKTPNIVSAESRSVGNSMFQSYCQLTNRAVNEFMQRVWDSEYKYSILPVCLIHDAIYLMIKNDVSIVKWVNDNLIECMQWQELPEIQHDGVKLEAELDIFYPDWSNSITLPNGISEENILDKCTK